MAHRSGFPGKVVFAGAVGEESRSKGIYSISRELQATDFAVFGEPSNTKDITVGYKGRLLVSVSVDTEAHHASAPWLGRNAVDVVYDILGRLRGEFGNGSQFRDTSCSVTRLSAGTAHNVTPSSARMLLDLRFPPSVTAAEAMERLRGVLGGDGSLRVRKLSSVEAYVSDMKSPPLVASFRRAIESVTGSRPSLLFKSGSGGDMNILGRLWGIPCITYGPGDPQMSHTRLEWVSAGDVEKAASVTAEALLGLGNVSRGGD
ncbi:M20/M25/M40 family metallo-hydrolase [Thermogymnomonas acidicola]|uniref:M20 family metallopeptidase n=1 Tax=Thermogymnomonas acidicola TaxID=399579 RepID=UPI000946142B|nr:M20/M25/M40 family metallo-hydrolase [Thermogymnomonas acidicola]